MTAPTHYQVLGIDPAATAEQVRRAYRTAAKARHPDVDSAAGADARFARLAAAYETLSDRRKRSAYDLSLRHPSPRAPGRGVPTAPAHYPWTNIGAAETGRSSIPSELDELYETFFTPHAPAE